MAQSKKKCIEFANFQGTLGITTGVTHYLEEILIPAFVDDNIFPDPKALPFYLADVVISPSEVDGNTSVAICGRYFIKKKFIKTQDYDPSTKMRKKAHEILEDYPSAIFWIDLLSHHLVYVKETPFAPSMKQFETACNLCLRHARKKYLESKAAEEHPKEFGRKKYLSELLKSFPGINLNIVSFHSKDLLEQMFARITRLQRIDLTFVADNATQLNLRPLQREILAAQGGITIDGSSRHSLVFSTSGKESTLDKEGAKAMLDEIAGKAYGAYKFKGKDDTQEDIKGDSQDNISLRDHVEINTDQPMGLIAKILAKLHIKQGIPNNTIVTERARAIIASIRSKLDSQLSMDDQK